MTTPTPDEQALTEQIAQAIRRATDEGASRTEDYARAVLPVVKAAQRDALTAFSRDEQARAAKILNPERANRRLQSADAAELFRDRRYPEEPQR